MESRFLAGNVRVYERFLERFRRAARRKWRSLVSAVIAARNEERHQYGETAYLLEPNIKRSRGGLRDVQSVRWLGFLRYGEREPEGLRQIGALPPADRRRLVQAHEFLLRLRNELHFHAGKCQDHLTRNEQVRLAELYRYQKLSGVLPVERFMRDFFEQSGHVRYVSANFMAQVRAVPSRLIAALAPLVSHRVERDFRVGPAHVSVTRKGLHKVTSDLSEVLRLMELANLYQKRIDHRTWEAIRNAVSQRPPEEISEQAIQPLPVAVESARRAWPICCANSMNCASSSSSFPRCSTRATSCSSTTTTSTRSTSIACGPWNAPPSSSTIRGRWEPLTGICGTSGCCTSPC